MVKIQVRRGTTSQWASANPVLAAGEPGYDTTLKRAKTGDGVTVWTALPWGAPTVDELEATYVQLPGGGIDGQVLVKAGLGLAWADMGNPGGTDDGPLALASPTYKTAALAAGTNRLRILTIGDSTNDGFGNPGGPDTWAKTWPLKLAELLRTDLGVAAGGRGWIPPSTPLEPGNYAWTPAALTPSGYALDDLTTQVGIPGSLWAQRGHATNVDEVTWALSPGVTAVDVVTTGYSGNMTITAANTGASITKDSTGDRTFTRIANPGATINVHGETGVGLAILGIIEYLGDATAGVTQWNMSRGAMRAFEYAGWLTDPTFSLKPMIDVYDPHVALVCLGSNDYQTGRTTTQLAAALTTIHSEIKSASAATDVVFIIRPLADDPEQPDTWETYSDTIAATATTLGAHTLNLRGFDGAGYFLPDDVHFTDTGNYYFAKEVQDYMKVQQP